MVGRRQSPPAGYHRWIGLELGHVRLPGVSLRCFSLEGWIGHRMTCPDHHWDAELAKGCLFEKRLHCDLEQTVATLKAALGLSAVARLQRCPQVE